MGFQPGTQNTAFTFYTCLCFLPHHSGKFLVNGGSFTLCTYTSHHFPAWCLHSTGSRAVVHTCLDGAPKPSRRRTGAPTPCSGRGETGRSRESDGSDRAGRKSSPGTPEGMDTERGPHTHLSNLDLNGLCVLLYVLLCVVFNKVCDFISRCVFINEIKRINEKYYKKKEKHIYKLLKNDVY